MEGEEETRLFDALLSRAGLSADRYRPRALRRRLPACLRLLRAETAVEAARRLEERPELTGPALSVLLLGVSEFFRDETVFAWLEREFVPVLAARPTPPRIWSVGCSAGQELYSVAMLLSEAGHLRGAELVGTDCRRDAVEQARTGVYPWSSIEPVAAQRRDAFFVRTGQAGVVHPGLRAAITWRAADVFVEPAPGPWDLILWRNMAIYLQPDAVERVWQTLGGAVADGGYIVTGKADPAPVNLPLTRVASCVYRRLARTA